MHIHGSFLYSPGFLEMLFYWDEITSGHKTADLAPRKRSPVFLLQLLDAVVSVFLPLFQSRCVYRVLLRYISPRRKDKAGFGGSAGTSEWVTCVCKRCITLERAGQG